MLDVKTKHVLACKLQENFNLTAFTGINLSVKVVRVGNSIKDCMK